MGRWPAVDKHEDLQSELSSIHIGFFQRVEVLTNPSLGGYLVVTASTFDPSMI